MRSLTLPLRGQLPFSGLEWGKGAESPLFPPLPCTPPGHSVHVSVLLVSTLLCSLVVSWPATISPATRKLAEKSAFFFGTSTPTPPLRLPRMRLRALRGRLSDHLTPAQSSPTLSRCKHSLSPHHGPGAVVRWTYCQITSVLHRHLTGQRALPADEKTKTQNVTCPRAPCRNPVT